MNLKLFVSRWSINSLLRFNARFLSTNPNRYTFTAPKSNSPYTYPLFQYPNFKNTVTSNFYRFIQSTAENPESEESEEEDATMSEFLSRFVWIMRGKLKEVYTDHDKKTIDAMLLFIVEKVLSEMENGSEGQTAGSDDNLSEDLWTVVREVRNKVTVDMVKAARKEKLKSFLQCEEVKELCKFAGEIGIRGDMLRELRFKFAREKMEDWGFCESIEKMKREYLESLSNASKSDSVVENESDSAMREDQKVKYVCLPRRHGKIKYKIYGLDLSASKWSEVADKINESDQVLWPQEPKLVSGECKLVMQKILSLGDEDDCIPLLSQWREHLNPGKIEWIHLLQQIKDKNSNLYFKVAEALLSEQSFEADTKDYANLIDMNMKCNRLEGALRIVDKMSENGIVTDFLAQKTMIQLYSEAGMMDKAQAILDNLNNQGFKPNMGVFKSMVIGYMKSNNRRSCEACDKLLTQMRNLNMNPTKEIYMAVLRAYAQNGVYEKAVATYNAMLMDGLEADFESCGLMVEAYAKVRGKERVQTSVVGAKYHFDDMTDRGFKHDDWTTSCMISAYQKANNLDKALELLLKLEKEQGFEAGMLTYTVLLEWLCELELVDEAEQVLTKMAALGETPSHIIHINLLNMYASVGAEKKALEHIGVLEAKKDELSNHDFDRVIEVLKDTRFREDALRFKDLMEARGYTPSPTSSLILSSFRKSSSTGSGLKQTRPST